jgi:hypothetical protein
MDLPHWESRAFILAKVSPTETFPSITRTWSVQKNPFVYYMYGQCDLNKTCNQSSLAGPWATDAMLDHENNCLFLIPSLWGLIVTCMWLKQ